MGHGYTFICPHCGQKNDLLEGTGYRHGSAEDRLFTEDSPETEDVPEDLRKICLDRIHNGWKARDCTYQIRTCPNCRTLEECTVITLEKDGETYTTKYRCKTCGAELQRCEHPDTETPYTVTCRDCKTPFTAKPEPDMFRWD